jgi:hypothetical protein
MPCLTHWHIRLCHMEVGRTLVLSPSTYNTSSYQAQAQSHSTKCLHLMSLLLFLSLHIQILVHFRPISHLSCRGWPRIPLWWWGHTRWQLHHPWVRWHARGHLARGWVHARRRAGHACWWGTTIPWWGRQAGLVGEALGRWGHACIAHVRQLSVKVLSTRYAAKDPKRLVPLQGDPVPLCQSYVVF